MQLASGPVARSDFRGVEVKGRKPAGAEHDATLRIAYLAGRYPTECHTFILGEIRELRRLGVSIDTFSIWRSSPEQLPSPAERDEFARTYALLPPRLRDVATAHLRAAVRSPLAYLRTLLRAMRMSSPGARNRMLGVTWFVEAIVLWRQLVARRLRHVHVHLNGTAPVVAMLATGFGNRHRPPERSGGWSWSLTVHGSKEFYDAARERLGEKLASARFVACISDYTRSQMMAFSPEGDWHKLHVRRCGVDTEEFSWIERARAGPTRILTVGRLDRMKGNAVLLRALARLVRAGTDAELVVVGDGPERHALEQLARELEVESRTTWTGTVGQDEIRRYYADADVFCLPSFAEGIPIVLMEAMATGLPVVANMITAIPELVDDGVSGILVRPGREDLLAEALGRLAADPDLRLRLGRAARQTVVDEYSLRAAGAAVGRLLQDELGAPAKRVPAPVLTAR